MIRPIFVTLNEYYAIGFNLVIFGLFFTMNEIFAMPNLRKDTDEL